MDNTTALDNTNTTLTENSSLMDKQYQPHEIEKKWYQHWESAGYFQPEVAVQEQGKVGKPSKSVTSVIDKPNADKRAGANVDTAAGQASYCIMLPPPNVTGSLHMGHGFQHTLMDALIRYQRMQQHATLWQAGTDHAGIATQMVVERQLAVRGQTRQELGREAFVKKVWEWRHESGNTITQQLRRMGSSLDWSRECFTMDPHFSEAVIEVFVRLYDEGLIYRGQRLVNWDVKFQTAVSDLEVVNQAEKGSLWYFTYPLADSKDQLTIATTRPETLLGDTAVAVHPDDPRYQRYIGKQLRLPLTERFIPVIADVAIDPEFATGCVKVTPAHDFNDYALARRHDLPMINIFHPDATLNDAVPEKYRGLSRTQARTAVVADMDALGLLEKTVPHDLNVPRGDRSHEIIEPMLTYQWFVKAKPLAEPALAAVATGKIRFIPENWTKTYNQWLENIEDWCISRQLWWGHRIPAWFDTAGNIYVGRNEQEVRQKYQLRSDLALTQDQDVLDTWFSSALWPFATLGWPNETAELKQFFPTQVLVTGFDIIFFWVARMIMMSLKFTGTIPFHEVYITGLIRDAHGQKMSKSKGNVLDPIDLIDGIDLESLVAKRTKDLMQPDMARTIEKATRKEYPDGIPSFGTDALRFTFCALASTGRDIRFDLGRLEGNHFFCNKIWNAARYVLQRTEDFSRAEAPAKQALTAADRWILSRLDELVEKTHGHFQQYRFDLLAQGVYEFTWNTFCDWYLELSKPILLDANAPAATRHATQWTLLTVLETLLRLLHPLMPYITEEIWQKVKMPLHISGDSIMLQAYPVAQPQMRDAAAVADIEWLQTLILAIRNIRGEMNISPAKQVSLLLTKGTDLDRQRSETLRTLLQFLGKCDRVQWLSTQDTPPPSATGLLGSLEILIPLAGLVDTQSEQDRLNKELQKLESELIKAQNKLQNPNFADKAPADVVAQERDRLKSFQQQIERLTSKKQLLQQL